MRGPAGPQPIDWADVLTRVLPLCDIVSPSLDDMRSALGDPELDAAEAAEWLLERGAAVVAVTDGPRGLVVRTAGASRFAGAAGERLLLAALPASWHDRRVDVPAAPGPVVQTTGAGDAATAALLAAVHSGMSLERVWSWCGRLRPTGSPGWGRLRGSTASPRTTTLQAAPDER